ncbi:hypothetical protein D3C79_34450 [compost metagenome]
MKELGGVPALQAIDATSNSKRDGVSAIAPDKIRHENGHSLVDLSDPEVRGTLGLKALTSGIVCLQCGRMRSVNGSAKPCPGKIRIGLR